MSAAPRTPSVAVVGAGISGVACARVLHDAGVTVRLHERGRVVGGRMASRTLAGRRVDLGASYLVAEDPAFGLVVDDWVRRGLARPWTDAFDVAGPRGLERRSSGPLRHGAAHGLRSLVEDLATGLDVVLEHEVQQVGPGPTVDGVAHDAVVLALPGPQAERLLSNSLAQERALCAAVPWEPVIAVAAGFARRSWDLDGCFVNDAPVLGWVADDGARRGDGAPVLVAHTTSAFAAARLGDPQSAAGPVVDAVRALLALPAAPDWTRVHRWSLARPVAGLDEPFALSDSGIGLCGDAWGRPRVETAWQSGTRLGEELARRLA